MGNSEESVSQNETNQNPEAELPSSDGESQNQEEVADNPGDSMQSPEVSVTEPAETQPSEEEQDNPGQGMQSPPESDETSNVEQGQGEESAEDTVQNPVDTEQSDETPSANDPEDTAPENQGATIEGGFYLPSNQSAQTICNVQTLVPLLEMGVLTRVKLLFGGNCSVPEADLVCEESVCTGPSKTGVLHSIQIIDSKRYLYKRHSDGATANFTLDE